MSASPDHVDVVVADDGSVPPVSRAEVARLGARPGEHLRLVRADGPQPRHGRKRVRGILVGRVEEAEVITDQDFADAKRQRLEAADRRYGPLT
jgi:hypothetical protein